MSAVRTPGGIGVAIRGKEDPELIAGRGRFVDDIQLPGLLHLVSVRSPHAHADITAIDTGAALAVPGVVAVFTADDAAAAVPCASNPTGDAKQPLRMPLSAGRGRRRGGRRSPRAERRPLGLRGVQAALGYGDWRTRPHRSTRGRVDQADLPGLARRGQGGRMEGGFGFPFGGDPEDLIRGLREFAEQQAETVQESQKEHFSTLTLNTAVQLTAAALDRVTPTGSPDEQTAALRDAMRVLFPEAVALVSAARQGFLR